MECEHPKRYTLQPTNKRSYVFMVIQITIHGLRGHKSSQFDWCKNCGAIRFAIDKNQAKNLEPSWSEWLLPDKDKQ